MWVSVHQKMNLNISIETFFLCEYDVVVLYYTIVKSGITFIKQYVYDVTNMPFN